MVAKFLTFFGLVAVAAAGIIPAAPLSKVVYTEPEAPAQYEFSYSVQDSHSGDLKNQQESRSGDAVHGSYSLLQPDGLTRIVEYTSDEHQGFNANVRYEGTAVQQAPVAKIAYAPAPITKVGYAAPVAKLAYSPAPINYAAPAPVTYAQAPQISYAQAPRISYAQAPQISYAQAPQISYAQAPQISYAQAPQISYAQAPQISYASAPIAKVGYAAAPIAKVAYTENLGRVTFSSPAISYQH